MINRIISKTACFAVLFAIVAVLGWSERAACQIPARVFTTGSHNEIHFGSGGGFWCVHIEPINNAFQASDIDPCTVVVIFNGGGSASSVAYNCTKPAIVGDGDGNGIQDIQLCFLKSDLAPLFDNLHGRKPKTVTLGVNGSLITGGTFTGSITLQVYLMD
jgi:hypothetical protein